MRRASGLLLLVALLQSLPAGATSQSAPFRVLTAGPHGELRQLTDANEIRVVFSEPMVPLGRIPSNPMPEWIRITPAIPGVFRWSGTTILIFTPDPARPLPNATRYQVRIEPTAAAVSGRHLGQPLEFEFTTPTVRLESARWARRDGRFDRPVTLALRFNQRVRPDDVVRHLTVRHQPHGWQAPTLTDRERAWIQSAEPAALSRFDAKVAEGRQVAARTDPVAVRIATDWDRTRFPPSDTLVVLETTTVPPPGAWLQLTLDTAMPSPSGPALPPAPQQTIVELPQLFVVTHQRCKAGCDPSGFNPVFFSEQVRAADFAKALTVHDITTPGAAERLAPTRQLNGTDGDVSTVHGLEDAGFTRQPPARDYVFRFDPGLTAEDGQTLGYPWIGIVENWHERAFTSFGDRHGVWETGGGVRVPFYSRNYTGVTERRVRLTPDELMPRIAALEEKNFAELPPVAGTARALPVTPDVTQSHGVDLGPILSSQGTGLAWVAVTPGAPIERAATTARTTSTVVQVTNLGITVKDSPQSTLVFVTRLDTGEPVAAANVAIVNRENQRLWTGRTDAEGIALAPALPLRTPREWYRLSFLVTAEKDGDVAYVGSNWNEGIQPWDFGVGYGLWEATDILRGSVFTDRGVYRPGEQVHVKAIVRSDTPTGMRLLPAGATLEVRTHDARNQVVDRRSVTVGRWSSVEWSWTVPAEATLGNYRVQAMLPGAERPEGNDVTEREPNGAWLKEVTGSFLVAAYRKPDFRVDTTLAAGRATAGDAMQASVEARYLFGTSLGPRPVRWALSRSIDLSVPAAVQERYPGDRYAFGYYPEHGNGEQVRVAGEDATLGADGRLTLTLPTDADVDLPYRYTFEGDVEDVSRQHIANRSSLVVAPAPWFIGLRRPAYFADTRTGTSVDVVVAGPDGLAVPGIAVTLRLIRVQWNSVRRAEGSGFYTWETERLEIPAGEWSVQSTAEPVPVPIPVPEGGYYILTATARDAEGHRTRTDVNFYGLGAGYTAWARQDHLRITLEPERRTWKPGETARVMIQSPWESATALLTVEREGIRQHRRFALTSTQQTVDVPITEDDIPNLYVSVLLIRGRTSTDPGDDGSDPGKPAFRLGYTELLVADDTKKLALTVAADRAEYRPANTAKVSITVSDAGGRPAASEVTLWAVDHGVLSLTGYEPPDVLRSVYQHKSLQVMNEDSRQRIISRRVLTPKGETEGGGGGDASDVRRDFRPLAFWLGSVETNREGRATAEVRLPDALTTYRIMAVAGDRASRFGSANAEIRVSKPVTLLAALPRFLTRGDRASFGATVTNTLTTGGEATVTIESLDPSIVEFTGDVRQRVRLEGGTSAAVRMEAVARGIGSARVRLRVTLDGNSDTLETTLPVGAPARVETLAAFGDMDARVTERLAIPAGVLPAAGGLDLSLASSALVGLGEGARYLADYPYGCAEQKASAALALILAADLGGAFSMGRIAPADYKARAASLIAELPRFQCGDGGFALWASRGERCRTGSFYLTAYVLHVMRVASRFGIGSDAAVITRGLDFLDAQLRAPAPNQVQWLPAWSASAAFGTRVLAEHGRNQDSNVTRLLGTIDRLPVFGLSSLADAMAAGGARGPRYDDVLRRLTNALRVEGNRAHVEEIDSDALAWLWNSNTRSTALVLQGFVERGDDPVLVAALVRWLLQARENGRWRNTQENATALEALVAYYRRFEADVPDMTARASLDGRSIGTARFRGRSSAAQEVALAMPDLLRRVAAGTDAELAIERSGTGRLYYAARLRYVPDVAPSPTEQGMRVERRYERYVAEGASPAATAFLAGDLIRVTLAVTTPAERRYVAVTDALPAGVEAVDGWFRSTAADLAQDASSQPSDDSFEEQWRRGGFDRVEKFDDRVVLFATRLNEGRHEFSYVVRATTAGTFTAAGTWVEEMYAPEVHGRAPAARIDIR